MFIAEQFYKATLNNNNAQPLGQMDGGLRCTPGIWDNWSTNM